MDAPPDDYTQSLAFPRLEIPDDIPISDRARSLFQRPPTAHGPARRTSRSTSRMTVGEPQPSVESLRASLAGTSRRPAPDRDGGRYLLEPTAVMPAEAPVVDLDQFFDESGALRRPPRGRALRGTGGASGNGRAGQVRPDSSWDSWQLIDEIGANESAQGTRDRYGWGAKAWIAWCRKRGVCPLPADPYDVIDHLALFCVVVDENDVPQRAEDGTLVQRTSVSSVNSRLYSIRKLHEYAELPDPTKTPAVDRFMRGLRRTFPIRPRRAKLALDYAALCLLVGEADVQLPYLRMRVWLLLRARLGISVARMARLEWGDVAIDQRGVSVTTYEAGRTNPTTQSLGRHPDRTLCLTAALEDLRERSLPSGPLVRIKGKPAAARTAHYVLTKVAGDRGWVGLAGLTDSYLAPLLKGPDAPSLLISARNVALLTVTWWTAFRRSNSVALRWEDLTWVPQYDSWRVVVRRSKTDQEGRGAVLWVPTLDDPLACPARALHAWHRLVTERLGEDPMLTQPRLPVFGQITRGGALSFPSGRGISGDVVNHLVQDMVIRAGIWRPTVGVAEINPYGAHSLRAGFVTEALRGNKLTIQETASMTGHVRAETLLKYAREVNAPTNNPARKLERGLRDGQI